MTLKGLVLEAYQLRPHQIVGASDWFDGNEFKVDARSGEPASPKKLRQMIQALLRERFGFAFHRNVRQMNVYALIVDKGGSKIRPLPDSSEKAPALFPDFRGDLQDLADLIGVQLSIPSSSHNSPVQTARRRRPTGSSCGLQRLRRNHLDLKPDATGDMFTSWQRFLQKRCGLKLESRKSEVQVLVVDSAAKVQLMARSMDSLVRR